MADAKKARAVGFSHVALEVGDIEDALVTDPASVKLAARTQRATH